MALDSGLSDLAATFAGLGTLLSGRAAWATLSGMETSAFAFVAALAVARWTLSLRDFKSALWTGVRLQLFLSRQTRAPLSNVVLVVVLVAFVLGSIPGLRYWATFFGRGVADIQKMHVAARHWLAEHSEPGDLVATHDVGAIACLSDRYIIMVHLDDTAIAVSADLTIYECD